MKRPSDLRLQRLRLGVSSYDIAHALRVSRTLVCYWETGERKISDKHREKLMKYLLTRATTAA